MQFLSNFLALVPVNRHKWVKNGDVGGQNHKIVNKSTNIVIEEL